jgi:hypothetical protein
LKLLAEQGGLSLFLYLAGGEACEGGVSRNSTPVKPPGQNQAATATTRTQNQNHSLRVCLLCSTNKLSIPPSKRIKGKNVTGGSKLFFPFLLSDNLNTKHLQRPPNIDFAAYLNFLGDGSLSMYRNVATLNL